MDELERDAGKSRWRVPCICIFLAVITFLVFGRTLRHEFINYDDNLYVTANPLVIRGLTLHGVFRVFTHFETRFYTPLTMLSHMADCQFYGLRPGLHHLTNVILHAVTAVLLFLVIRRLTGATWRSAFVAGVFAVHPLHVESVAWVAERNDVLSGVFFGLTVGAYLHYTRRPGSVARYSLVTALFICGLLSKPTLVMLPVVLLILDYWPLGRFAQGATRLVMEKIPLLALSAGAGVLAYLAEGKSVASLQAHPLSSRIANALVSCVVYLRQMVWPSNLAIFYPRPADGLPAWEVIGAFAVLAGISVVVFVARKRCPYLMAGWLWYLAMLAPAAGIVQIGEFAHADRYTYLSQIGLYLALTWGAVDMARALRLGHAPAVAGGVSIIALAVCSAEQVAWWRDSESIFRRALECTTGNYVACNNLGLALAGKGHDVEAIAIYKQGLGFCETSAPLHDNLGRSLFATGDSIGAIHQYLRALEIEPDSVPARYNLGNALLITGDPRGAIIQWRQCLEAQPNYTGALTGLAWVLATCADDAVRNGAEAVQLAQRANQLSGGTDPIVLHTLGAALAESGNFVEAAQAARRAAQIAAAQGNTPFAQSLEREAAAYDAGTRLRAAAVPKPEVKP